MLRNETVSISFEMEADPEPAEVQEEAAVAAGDDAAPVAGAVDAPAPGPRTLAIDIGGTGLKVLVLDARGGPIGERRRVDTPRPATPQAVLQALAGLLPEQPYDRVSVGFPGVVVDGVVRTAPNLDPQWHGFDVHTALSTLTGRPTRVINDAGMQGLGLIAGRGVEMVLTLGTGMGCALFVDGHYVPNVELAHHPLRKGRTYEQYIGNAARKAVGNRRWNRRVRRVVDTVLRVFNPRVLYLGGGNARKLEGPLPPAVEVRDNLAGLLGGVALWR